MQRNVESFAELDVYQEACALDFALFELTKTWPKEEMYSLTDQIRRSSRSVGANIAEAWLRPVGAQTIGFGQERDYAPEGAKRRYPAHFTSKLTDADAELQETQHWLMRAKAYGYFSTAAFDPVWQMAKQVGRRLGSMLKSGDWS